MAAWLAFAILLVFGYAKFYWLVLDPAPVKPFFPEWWSWRHFEIPATLLDAFLMQTLGFSGFCLAVFFYGQGDEGSGESPRASSRLPVSAPWRYFAGLAGLLMVSVFLIYRFKIGLMGTVSAPLPFHLAGAIFFLHTMLLPILIVCFICFSEASRKYLWARAGMGLLLFWAVADVILRSSRASLMLVPLLLLFLAVSGGIRIRKLEAAAGGSIALLAIVLSPLIWSYRVLRLSGYDPFPALKSALFAFSPGIGDFLKAFSFIFFRIPGIEISVIVSGFKVKALGSAAFPVLFSEKGYSWYLGHFAFGLPFDAPNGFATPFIAQWYMAWGYPGIFLAGVAAGVSAVFIWDRLAAASSPVVPIVRTFFLLLMFWALTEGVSPTLFKQLFVCAIVFLLLELFALNLSRRTETGP